MGRGPPVICLRRCLEAAKQALLQYFCTQTHTHTQNNNNKSFKLALMVIGCSSISEAFAHGEEVEIPLAVEVVDIALLSRVLRHRLMQQVHEEKQIVVQVVLLLHVQFEPMRRPGVYVRVRV